MKQEALEILQLMTTITKKENGKERADMLVAAILSMQSDSLREKLIFLIRRYDRTKNNNSVSSLLARIIISTALHYRNDAAKYIVKRNLVDRLCETRVTGLTRSHLSLPYPFIEIIFEGNKLLGTRDGLPGRRAKSFVFDCPTKKDEDGINIFHFVGESDRLEGASGFGVLEIALDDKPIMWASEIPVEADDDSEISDYEENKRASDSILNATMNAIVYATHIETRELLHNQAAIDKTIDRARRTTGRKQARAQQELAQLRLSSRIVLGSGVKRLERQGSKTMTLVQGHWRNQVCGPKNSKRKLIWIEPFWRGDLGKGVVRDHVL